MAQQIRSRKGVSSVLIPQNLLYPGLQLNIDRERASLIGLTPKQVVDNVITALTSNGMIEPSYWIDPKTGNNYMLTVQYFDKQIQNMSMEDFKQIPLRAPGIKNYTPLQSVAHITPMNAPTEVDHYQLQRDGPGNAGQDSARVAGPALHASGGHSGNSGGCAHHRRHQH